MGFRLEDAAAAVAAPDVGGRSCRQHVSIASIDGARYLAYAAGALVVVLLETQEVTAAPTHPRTDARRPSRFALWQTYAGGDVVRCLQFNPSRRAARGALALCVDEGRGVLLLPSSGGDQSDADYARTHLQLQLPTWRESMRWRSEDRLMDRLEWVESGAEDLLLVGAGEKVTIWKVVDDAAQVYLQRSFSLRAGPDRGVAHFDATSGGGRFLATAAAHDRVVKVWNLHELDRDGAPLCAFLAHPRAVRHLVWAKDSHAFKLRASAQSTHAAAGVPCEMLFTLDRAGNVSIWRENVVGRSFVLWKIFSGDDYALQLDAERFFADSDRENAGATIRTFGLVGHSWARPAPGARLSIPDAMLDEENVLSALAMFHYGYVRLDDARRGELYSQRMDGTAKMNSKLLGDKCGALADTHAGEAFIAGNATLAKTFAVYLLYGVHDNGDLCLFRTEYIPHSGVTPRLSLLLMFSGLRAELVDAEIIDMSSSDYRDRENGSSAFVIEIVYQPQSVETHLKVARLRLQADISSFSSSGRGNHRGLVAYSVQSCEVGDVCGCMFGAKQHDGGATSLSILKVRASSRAPSPQHNSVGPLAMKVAVSTIGNRLDIFRPSALLRTLQVECRPHPTRAMSAVTHSVCFDEQSVLFFFAQGKLHAACVTSDSRDECRGSTTASFERGSMQGGSFQGGSSPTPGKVASTSATVCFVDSVDELDGTDDAPTELADLAILRVPDSQKFDWSSSSSSLFGHARPSSSQPSKDFCVVVGLKQSSNELLVWVFSFEHVTPSPPSPPAPAKSDSDDELGLADPVVTTTTTTTTTTTAPPPSLSVTLFRKTQIMLPQSSPVRIASVPSLEAFELVFASMDAQLQFTVWTFADTDDLLQVKSMQQTSVADVIKTATATRQAADVMSFRAVEDALVFKQIVLSACGRVAVLYEKASGGRDAAQQSGPPSTRVGVDAVADGSICILQSFESCGEGIVAIDHKKLGVVVSLEWTPPVTAERACELLFLSTTTIGVIRFDASLPTHKWFVAWSSSRFSVKPQKISTLSSYPHALLVLESSIASVNLHDLSGASATGMYGGLPFRVSQPIGAAQPLVNPYLPPKASFPAHHPVTLLFLLLRGSFRSLERVLDHVRASVVAHEKACYLRMLDDAQLDDLPLLPLSQLLGLGEDGRGDDNEERSAVYLSGKTLGASGAGGYSSAPARASDLFAMDYRSTRSADRAEMLFAPRSSSTSSSSTSADRRADDTAASPSALESAELASFFNSHKSFLTFMTRQDADVFLLIVNGLRRTVAWERDSSRKKDEAALRFHASLLWPLQSDGGAAAPAAATKDSDEGNATTSGDVARPGDDESGDAASDGGRAVGICSEQVVWGAITDCQDELLHECFPTPTLSWKEMQQLRLPFWVKRVATLQQFTERVAQSEYASTRDPFHVALFYVLLGKTTLLARLFKLGNESRIADLLSNDFSEPRWKNAAIKNAYVLKAKRRYALSTAFFLLGSKVQEAMAVAEHADPTLVLSFLIARLTEKWDLGGASDHGAGSGASAEQLGAFSFTGLSSSMRSLRGFGDSTAVRGDSAVGPKGVCEEFLKSSVWATAQACDDVYMSFLVKYFLGETQSAIQCLLAVPSADMRCMFDAHRTASTSAHTLYWRAFGQSMLGASEIVRYLQPSIAPLRIGVKTQIVRLQTLVLSRAHTAGLHTVALLQQRDFARVFVQFCRDCPRAPEAAAFLAARHRILVTALGAQVDWLYAQFLDRIRDAMMRKSASPTALSTAPSMPALESGINKEIESLVARGGAFALDTVLETANAFVEAALRSSVAHSLVHSYRLTGLDFLVAGWRARPETGAPLPQFPSALPHFVEVITEGIAVVALGDMLASATDPLHTRRIDQTCSQLLAAASRLLLWLSYYYSKAPDERDGMTSSEFVRVASAAIYSVVCICCRYTRSPCCVYRSLRAIFPHKDALPRKLLDDLKEIALSDVCVFCTGDRNATGGGGVGGGGGGLSTASTASSLQQAIPALYRVVEMQQDELNAFVSGVKTNRLQLASAAASPYFTYCQYWTLVLMMSAGGMPAHLAKIAVDGANPVSESTIAAKKLVQAWATYVAKLSRYAARKLLCDFADLYFRPFELASATSASATSAGDARTTSPSAGASATSSSASSSGPSGSPKKEPSHRDTRRLLGCACARCPWLLLLKVFAEKDELLLRLHAQVECCSEKITNEIRWGHLPDFPSKKAVLTRSQKILLSTAAGAKASPGTPRAADLVDLFEKRMQAQAPVVLHTSCIYRSEVSLKSMCFNRATEAPEMILCSSKGICRTGCADYSDGSKFQFKGMYANPQASFFSDGSSHPSMAPVRRRTATDPPGGASTSELSAALGPPLSIGSRMLAVGSPSSSLGSSPSDAKAPSFKPAAVESHPFLPLFASGNQKGKVHLWSFDSLSAVCEFQTGEVVASYPSSPSLSSRRDVKKIKFDSLGQQMGAVDTLGRLFVWKFSNLDRESCYRQIECHDKGAKALTYINSGSCVATVGSSSDKRSVCMWDLLLPTAKALVAAPVCHPAGAASVAFSPSHQLLISGGEGGSISVFDVRQRRVLHTVSNAHETAITTLELHPSGHCVLSGSASGDVKIWSLPIFREVTSLSKVHAKPSFLGDAASNLLGDAASSWGVTDAVATDDYFFTSGTDGSVQRMRVPSLSKLF
ncbi:hypothetical protein PybrP1_008517 [[Pythium] brassicae (nom. inval.)]|nr:hypothetical protein PybrP1_008517 [[Pythium] brassicae (nom. inval.)]